MNSPSNDDLKKEIADLRQSVHELTKTVQELTAANSTQQHLAVDHEKRVKNLEGVMWGADPLGLTVDANSVVGMARSTKFYLRIMCWVSAGGLTTLVSSLLYIINHIK